MEYTIDDFYKYLHTGLFEVIAKAFMEEHSLDRMKIHIEDLEMIINQFKEMSLQIEGEK